LALCPMTEKERKMKNDICFQVKMEAFAKKKGKEGTRGSNLIAKENQETMTFYRNMILGVNCVYYAVMFLFARDFGAFEIIMLVMSSLAYIFSFMFMRSMGTSTKGTDGHLLDPGVDLNMEGGLAEHLKDLIILTSLSQFLSLAWNWLWLLLLLAPLRLALMLWTNVIAPWIFQPAEEEEISDKKQKKLERKMKRANR